MSVQTCGVRQKFRSWWLHCPQKIRRMPSAHAAFESICWRTFRTAKISSMSSSFRSFRTSSKGSVEKGSFFGIGADLSLCEMPLKWSACSLARRSSGERIDHDKVQVGDLGIAGTRIAKRIERVSHLPDMDMHSLRETSLINDHAFIDADKKSAVIRY